MQIKIPVCLCLEFIKLLSLRTPIRVRSIMQGTLREMAWAAEAPPLWCLIALSMRWCARYSLRYQSLLPRYNLTEYNLQELILCVLQQPSTSGIPSSKAPPFSIVVTLVGFWSQTCMALIFFESFSNTNSKYNPMLSHRELYTWHHYQIISSFYYLTIAILTLFAPRRSPALPRTGAYINAPPTSPAKFLFAE